MIEISFTPLKTKKKCSSLVSSQRFGRPTSNQSHNFIENVDLLEKRFRLTYLREVSVVGGEAEVQLLGLVVSEHPREHRVLVQVVVRTPCNKNIQWLISCSTFTELLSV